MVEVMGILVVVMLAIIVFGFIIVSYGRRLDRLEANQTAIVDVLRKQVTNTTSLAGSVDQITRMRNHWLGLVKS